MGKLRSGVYNLARFLGDVEAARRGPGGVLRRGLNRTKGRLLARRGFWNWLWKKP